MLPFGKYLPNHVTAYPIILYLQWVSFATGLNAAYYALNRG
jgi:tryptophan-rich sensory protein